MRKLTAKEKLDLLLKAQEKLNDQSVIDDLTLGGILPLGEVFVTETEAA